MELTTTYTENDILKKAEVYKFLSVMYKEPKADLSVYVQQLYRVIKDYDESLLNICEEMNYLFEEGNQELDEYLVEYSKLFIGPFKVLAPPYSSIYLEDKWEVQSKSTQVVESFYKRAGLTLINWNEPKDHITAQLEYMYFLNFKWNETRDEVYLVLQKEFLYRILTHWIPKFNAAIQKGASLKFYKLLGNLTEAVILRDYLAVK